MYVGWNSTSATIGCDTSEVDGWMRGMYGPSAAIRRSHAWYAAPRAASSIVWLAARPPSKIASLEPAAQPARRPTVAPGLNAR